MFLGKKIGNSLEVIKRSYKKPVNRIMDGIKKNAQKALLPLLLLGSPNAEAPGIDIQTSMLPTIETVENTIPIKKSIKKGYMQQLSGYQNKSFEEIWKDQGFITIVSQILTLYGYEIGQVNHLGTGGGAVEAIKKFMKEKGGIVTPNGFWGPRTTSIVINLLKSDTIPISNELRYVDTGNDTTAQSDVQPVQPASPVRGGTNTTNTTPVLQDDHKAPMTTSKNVEDTTDTLAHEKALIEMQTQLIDLLQHHDVPEEKAEYLAGVLMRLYEAGNNDTNTSTPFEEIHIQRTPDSPVIIAHLSLPEEIIAIGNNYKPYERFQAFYDMIHSGESGIFGKNPVAALHEKGKRTDQGFEAYPKGAKRIVTIWNIGNYILPLSQKSTTHEEDMASDVPIDTTADTNTIGVQTNSEYTIQTQASTDPDSTLKDQENLSNTPVVFQNSNTALADALTQAHKEFITKTLSVRSPFTFTFDSILGRLGKHKSLGIQISQDGKNYIQLDDAYIPITDISNNDNTLSSYFIYLTDTNELIIQVKPGIRNQTIASKISLPINIPLSSIDTTVGGENIFEGRAKKEPGTRTSQQIVTPLFITAEGTVVQKKGKKYIPYSPHSHTQDNDVELGVIEAHGGEIEGSLQPGSTGISIGLGHSISMPLSDSSRFMGTSSTDLEYSGSTITPQELSNSLQTLSVENRLLLSYIFTDESLSGIGFNIFANYSHSYTNVYRPESAVIGGGLRSISENVQGYIRLGFNTLGVRKLNTAVSFDTGRQFHPSHTTNSSFNGTFQYLNDQRGASIGYKYHYGQKGNGVEANTSYDGTTLTPGFGLHLNFGSRKKPKLPD